METSLFDLPAIETSTPAPKAQVETKETSIALVRGKTTRIDVVVSEDAEWLGMVVEHGDSLFVCDLSYLPWGQA